MKFPHFFIQRPIFAAALSIIIVIMGAVAYPTLPVGQYPEIAPPTVVVTASYPGATAEPRLPEEVRTIGVTVRKNSPDLLMVFNLFSPDHSLSQQYVANYATLQLLDRIARIPGVGGTRSIGGRDYNMRIWIDPGLAASRNLTVDEIVAAVRAQNV